MPTRAPPSARGPWLGLRAKILLLAIPLAALPVLVASLSMIDSTQDELKSSVNDRLLSMLDRSSGRIQGALDPSLQLVPLLVATLDDPDLDAVAKLALLRRAIANLPGLAALQLAVPGAPPTFLLARSLKTDLERAALQPEQRLDSEAAPTTLVDDGLVIHEPIALAPLDTWLLPVSARLRQPIEGRAARLIAYLDVTRLREQLEIQDPAGGGEQWLLSPAGTPLLALTGRTPDPALSMRLSSDSLAAGVSLVTPYRDREGRERLAALTRLETPAWTLVVTLPSDRAYALVERMQRHLALWLGLGLVAAALGALLLAHRFSQPIRAMAAIADAVGAGDFRVRFDAAGRRDEIGTLGRRLNQMIAGLSGLRYQLERQALEDALTGLPNRRCILGHLERLMGDPETRHAGIALLFIDLDRFKRVNDSLGHAIGDRLLRQVAERLVEHLAPGALAARLGGDEFLVVLTGLRDRAAISELAESLIAAIRQPFRLMDYELYVGGTIGVSLVPEDGEAVAELLEMSDMAMYRAKEQGRGHVQFFHADLKRRAIRKLSLDTQLRKALDRDALAVYYQPQVELASGRIVATEALVRWPAPDGGFVASPAEFIPLAEETGLILPLGQWVMESVCRQSRAWQLAGLLDLSVSVNVSAMQFSRQDFLARVAGSLERSSLDGVRIGVELTEGVLLDDSRHAIRVMSRLKEMGVQILIDDFGTGYSSLAYLQRLPLDYIKVARELVMGIGHHANDGAIVSAVIDLAKSLGLKIIAEGVETSEQLEFLRARDCDLIQGFYFGRAVSAAAFESLLLDEEWPRRSTHGESPT